MEQLKRWADYVCAHACAHCICLPPFLPADFKEQAEPRVSLCFTGEIPPKSEIFI